MKRKADAEVEAKKPLKKRSKTALADGEAKQRFRKGLFDQAVLDKYTKEYATSSPYKHSVISGLIDDALLRAVRDEIRGNVSFTPKETDIYKIHQSGDLANLDGLDDDALAKLPSLLALRDAMYSDAFRAYVSHITGCGPLSGRKTDMAINVYTPGCYLLCHDDVIGSRKVSYILYLTDPDTPWQPEWGGALRLFPVAERAGADGEVAKTPAPDPVKVIPPAWNQLSFFAVQPGESFHDVEEVYHPEATGAAARAQLEKEGGRVRMAISGWFHIPQVGEDGYVEGAEEAQAKNSGLMQLQGNPDQHDRPEAKVVPVEAEEKAEEETEDEEKFTDADLDFLLKYMTPSYLTPDVLLEMKEHFDENFSITLPGILNARFVERVRAYLEKQEAAALPEDSAEIEKKGAWKVAKPPHKHRFLYLQQRDGSAGDGNDNPVQELLNVLLPSRQFRTWLEVATGAKVEAHDLVARRFRRGKDYTLATGHEGKPRLELNIGLTPTPGWGDDEEEESDEEEEEEEGANGNGAAANGKGKAKANDKEKANGKGKAKANGKSNGAASHSPNGKAKASKRAEADEAGEPEAGDDDEEADVGGHEVYMAGDEDGTEDAAVYRSGSGGDEDENILFFQAAAWNKMTIVLRDSGVLRFVKYVSRRAPGDRWDVAGTFEIEEQDDDDDDEEEEDEDENAQLLESEEEEFKGFSSSEESDSD